jgi:hypothetical protein
MLSMDPRSTPRTVYVLSATLQRCCPVNRTLREYSQSETRPAVNSKVLRTAVLPAGSLGCVHVHTALIEGPVNECSSMHNTVLSRAYQEPLLCMNLCFN